MATMETTDDRAFDGVPVEGLTLDDVRFVQSEVEGRPGRKRRGHYEVRHRATDELIAYVWEEFGEWRHRFPGGVTWVTGRWPLPGASRKRTTEFMLSRRGSALNDV